MQWSTKDVGLPIVFYGTESGKLLQVSNPQCWPLPLAVQNPGVFPIAATFCHAQKQPEMPCP